MTPTVFKQIIDIGRSDAKWQLYRFYAKRNARSRQKHFPKSIEIFVDDRQNYAAGNKHRGISNHIQQKISLAFIVKQMDKRNEIDSERKCGGNIKYKWLNMSVHRSHRKKRKSDDYRKIDIHQKQNGFSFQVYMAVFNPYRTPDD